MRTTNFQLTDSTIEIFKKDGQVIKLDYSDINSIQILEDKKYSMKSYTITYWSIWTVFVLGLFIYMAGLDLLIDVIKEYTVWGLILTLGLLAYRPIYSMLPTWTFMDIKSSNQTSRVSITDIIQNDQIHGLINKLKEKIDISKISITK